MSPEITRRGFIVGGLGIAGLATLGGGLLAGCAPVQQSATGKLQYQFRGINMMDGAPRITEAVNAYLADHDIEYTVALEPVADYDQAMRLKMSAGGAGDLFYTSPFTNNFYLNASQGNLLPLQDLLTEHAPDLYASLPESIWKAATVKGDILAVINQQRFPKLWGFFGQEAIIDELGMDINDIGSFEELEPFLVKVKEAHPDILPWNSDIVGNGRLFQPEIYGWDPISTAYGLAVKYDDDNLQIFSYFDTPEYKNAVKVMRRWREMGLVEANPPSGQDSSTRFTAGLTAFSAGQSAPTDPQNYPFPTRSKLLVPNPILNSDGVTATMIGLNADTANAVAAIQFLNLLNTDKDFYNLLSFGIEGDDYDLTNPDLGVVTVNPDTDWNPNSDWQFGCQFNAYYRNEADAKADRWAKEAEVNQTATPSKAIGFAFDVAFLQTQAAGVSAAVLQFQPQAALGLVDETQAVDQLLKGMDDAGYQDMLTAAQGQIDEWKKG